MSESRGIPWSRLVAEGLVIAASILLALAADAWWQERQDERVEREYLTAFRSDILDTRAEAERVLALQDSVRTHMLGLATRMDEGAALPDTIRRIFPAIYILGESMDSYRDLVASGGTTRIEDPQIRRAMARLLAQVEYAKVGEQWTLDLVTTMRSVILAESPEEIGRERLRDIWAVYLDALDRVTESRHRLIAAADSTLTVLDGSEVDR